MGPRRKRSRRRPGLRKERYSTTSKPRKTWRFTSFKETDELVKWFSAETRMQKAPLPEKLFAIIHRQLEYISPYEDFIGAVFFRSLQPNSKLSPLSFDSQELRLKYLRFIRDILADAEEKEEIPRVGELGAYAVGVFYIGIVL